MNTGGVIKGGLLAGLVINVLEGVLNGYILDPQWEAVMTELGFIETGAVMAVYVIGGFLIGILGVWLYAAARPRLGAGPGTAVKIGLALWFLGWFWPTLPFSLGGVLPAGLATVVLGGALIELPVAMLLGAWAYKEEG